MQRCCSPHDEGVLAVSSVASEAICKWGGTMPAPSAGRNFFDVPPHFSLVPPTWGGTKIVCYRLRDNWSDEVGRGAIKVMGLVYNHILILTAFLVRPLQEGHGCITSKTRSSADADNRLDAFSGQSRSTNTEPFHMLHIVSYCAIVT